MTSLFPQAIQAVPDTGAVAAKAESNKITKYAQLDSTCLFVPVEVLDHMLKILPQCWGNAASVLG